MVKTCLQCGREFKTYRTAAIYCGNACHNASQIRAQTYTCAQCGGAFQRANHVIKKAAKLRYCSPECHQAYRRAHQRVIPCVVCGKEFAPSHHAIRHCSKACRDKGLITQQERVCAQCGKPFTQFASEARRGRRFCSHLCAETHMVGAAHPNYRGGKWLKHGTRWKRIRQAVLERDKVCRLCGAERCDSGRSLHVHHIHGRRHYLIVDIANEMGNLVALCDHCHTYTEMMITHGRVAELPSWLRPPQ